MQKWLWLISYPEENGDAVRAALGPDVEVLTYGQRFVLVRAPLSFMVTDLDNAPAHAICHPPRGCYVGVDRTKVYIARHNVADRMTCAAEFGLKPQVFGKESWDDVDGEWIDFAIRRRV